MHLHNWDYRAVLLALLLSCGVASAQGIPSAVIGTPSSGGGGGGSVSITAATPNLVFTPSPLTGTGTVGTTNAQNSPADGGSHSYTVVAGDITKEVILAGTFTAAAVPQATGSFGAGSSFTLINKGAITATSTTSTINGIAGATGIKLGANQFSQWDSDGTNWIVGIGVAQPPDQTGSRVGLSDMTWTSAFTDGQIAVGQTGSQILAKTLSGDATLAASGALTIGANAITTGKINAAAVTYAKIQNEATVTLLGNPTGSPAAPGEITLGTNLSFSGTVLNAAGGTGGGGMFGYSDNGLTLTAGTRFVPIYGSGTPSTTEADYSTKSPSATTATNLQVNLSADPGAGQTLVVTLRKAGSDTALTCTVTGGSGVVCQDLTHSVNVAQNDLIDWKVVTTGTFVATPSVTILANNGTSNVGVTSIATTSPITGGTIATTGTIACATCVVASSPGVGIAHFAGSTQTVTSSAVNLAGSDVTGALPQTGIAPATFATGTTHTFVAPAEIWECTGTCTVTPPTPAAGYQFCVRNANGVSTVITLAAVASVLYEKTNFTTYGTANTASTSGGAVGDKVCIVGKDSTHYDVFAFNGTWSMP